MKHPIRPRYRQTSLFPKLTAKQRAAARRQDPETIRSGFPELTRCDHCDKLDPDTQLLEIASEKRWLHIDCALNFIPDWHRCDCYNDGLAESHYFRWLNRCHLEMRNRDFFHAIAC
jgi:hypothetical protein